MDLDTWLRIAKRLAEWDRAREEADRIAAEMDRRRRATEGPNEKLPASPMTE